MQLNKNKRTVQGRSFGNKSFCNGWGIIFALFVLSNSNIGSGFGCNISVRVIASKTKIVNSAGSCLFYITISSGRDHMKFGTSKSFFLG